MDAPGHVVAADWLIAMDRLPARAVRRGGVRIGPTGQVVAAGPAEDITRGGDSVTFHESAVLTPGLINAHAHLDMSYWTTAGRAGLAGRPLHDWVAPVVAERLLRSPGEIAAAAGRAAVESLAGGVTTVVDVTPAAMAWREVRDAVAATAIRQVALAEVLGFGERGEALWDAARRVLSDAPSARDGLEGGTAGLEFGISPHAPCSTCAAMYERGLALAREQGAAFMTHLSETREEIEFCRTGGGPWRTRIEQFAGPADEASFPIPRCSPVEYAERLGLLAYPRTLLAHVNYLEPGDMERLSAGRATVVLCPRSADYFGHRDHPWRRMTAAGVNVAIGTDSRASAPDESVLAELRWLHQQHREVRPAQLFALATRNAAAAIAPRQLGVLAEGAWADLVAWPARGGDDADAILGAVLDSNAAAVAVYSAGRPVEGSRQP